MPLDTAGWIGAVISGRYQIAGELGRGGMAIVYRAHDRRLGCDVVVKVPQAALFQDPGFVGRFVREVRSLVKLAHPHIVRITDVGEHDGLPFAVMQFLPGGSLRERQRKERDGKAMPLQAKELRRWLEEIASALDFMHRRGFVHRDVKPDNILFDDEGHVYLSDFGIAKALQADGARVQQTVLTGTGMVVGTAQYMAPEVILGEPYDGRADQYGLAVTVFELLSGRVPFEGTTPAAVAVQQQTKEAPSVDTLVPSVGRGVAEAVRKALARDPQERHQDCTTFAQWVLHALGENSQVEEPKPSAAAPETATAAAGAQGTVVQKAGVRCPHCAQKLRIPAKAHGKPVTCPKCKGRFVAVDSEKSIETDSNVTIRTRDTNQKTCERTDPIKSGEDSIRPLRRSLHLGKRNVVTIVLIIALASLPLFLFMFFLGTQLSGSVGIKPVDIEPQLNLAVDVDPVVEDSPPGEIRCFSGHTAAVSSVAFSPDGRFAASGSLDRTVRVWDITGGRELLQIVEHGAGVRSVAYSRDGLVLLSGSSDGTVRTWDSRNGKQLRSFGGHNGSVTQAVFSPDGTHIVSSSDDGIARIFDVSSGELLHGLKGPFQYGLTDVTYSPDGHLVLTIDRDGDARSWNARTGEEADSGAYGAGMKAALSPDGHYFFTTGVRSGIDCFSISATGKMSRNSNHRPQYSGPGKPISISFSREGNRILLGCTDGSLGLIDVTTGKELHSLGGHAGAINSTVFSPQGKCALTGGADHTVRLWKLPQSRTVKPPSNP